MRTSSSKDVAAALGVKPTTVQRYAREARVPYEQTPGGHRRFNVEEVRAALAREVDASFVEVLDLDPLAGGPAIGYSGSAVREAQLRTARSESAARSEPPPGGGPSELARLITTARRVLVSTSR